MLSKVKQLYSSVSNSKQQTKNNITKIVLSVIKWIVLLSIGYIIIFPLIQMIVTSVKDRTAFYNAAKVWLPSSFDIGFNFKKAFEAIDFLQGLNSTLVNEIIAGLIEVAACSITAYGFARFKFKFKNAMIVGLFLTILIPETMIVIPRILNYSNLDFLGILGLFDKLTGVDLRPNIVSTPFAFWLPSLFSMGLRSGILIYIYMQFFKGLPAELEEAAWVDGAGSVRTFVSIALPSSGVVFTTVIVFTMIWHWNDITLASVYMQENFPLAVNLSRIASALASGGYYVENDVQAQAIVMAACVMFILPPLILYMILQRKFIESIDRVGITG